jgi:hypothetical protein
MGQLKQRAIEYSYSNAHCVDQKQGDGCSRLPREESKEVFYDYDQDACLGMKIEDDGKLIVATNDKYFHKALLENMKEFYKTYSAKQALKIDALVRLLAEPEEEESAKPCPYGVVSSCSRDCDCPNKNNCPFENEEWADLQ